MDIQSVRGACFSPTGTTRTVVTFLTERLGDSLNRPVAPLLDFTRPAARQGPASFCCSDLVIVGVPTYAGRVPNVLLRWLNTLEGGSALAVPVVLFGNRAYDESLKELRNILEDRNFHTIAAGAFVGEHAFSTTLGQGRPDAADMRVATVFAQRIAAEISKGSCASPVRLDDESPVKPYYVPKDANGKAIDMRKVKPLTKDTCTQCGVCADLCPMGSIDPEDAHLVPGICIKCGACIKGCPVGAKYYEDGEYLFHKSDLEATFVRRAEPAIFLPS